MQPNSNHAVLSLLRTDPDKALANFGFVIGNDVYTMGNTGGPCVLSCESINSTVFRLTAKAGVGDYFFPYVNGNPGVGACTVAGGQPDGCIVTTGGMNGCSLQVNHDGNNLHFYHDNNGSSIANLPMAPPGNVVARVDCRHYEGPLYIGENLAKECFRSTPTVKYSGEHRYFCLNIHVGGRWKVYFSSILEKGTTTETSSFFFGDSAKKSLEYCTFKPTIYPCMASFDDA